ncbi:MAG: hypothetical protein CMF50_09240 [Legionellales bacterium]|nr:hypothetical protein [Legionellales bacterium]
MSIPVISLFLAAIFAIASKAPVIKAIKEQFGHYNNKSPREQMQQLAGWGARAQAAHQNMLESFPFFAAGVVVVLATGAVSVFANILCILYILSRIVYQYLYLANIDLARSGVWFVGYLCSLVLIILPLF